MLWVSQRSRVPSPSSEALPGRGGCSIRSSPGTCILHGDPTYSAVHPWEARATIMSLLQQSSIAAFPVHPMQSEQRPGNLVYPAWGIRREAVVPPVCVPWPLHTQVMQVAHLVSSIAGVLLNLCRGHRCWCAAGPGWGDSQDGQKMFWERKGSLWKACRRLQRTWERVSNHPLSLCPCPAPCCFVRR